MMARPMMAIVQAGVLAFALGGGVFAQDSAFAPDYRQLALGLSAREMPVEGIDIFACGSNGGPPLSVLSGWIDYAQCPTDQNGLHEVYIEFDTELQRLVESTEEQFGQAPWFKPYAGTRVANFAVVMSMLFDDEGIARGFRAITDPRAGLDERAQAFMLRLRVIPQYGRADWECIDREPGPRETPVGETYLNQFCEKRIDGKLITVESHLFRKAGQTGVDRQGQPIPGDYESLTRWEVYDEAYLESVQ